MKKKKNKVECKSCKVLICKNDLRTELVENSECYICPQCGNKILK